MDLKKTEKKICNAWIAGCVLSGCFFIAILALYVIGEDLITMITPLLLLLLFCGLSFGVYKRNLICVIALFILPVVTIVGGLTFIRQAVLAKQQINDYQKAGGSNRTPLSATYLAG